MASVAGLLDQALRAANIPIVGVSISDPADRAKWTVLFLPAATAADRTNAQTIVNTLAVDAAALLDADATSDADLKILKALVLGIWEAIPGPLLTRAQVRARIIAIYKTL